MAFLISHEHLLHGQYKYIKKHKNEILKKMKLSIHVLSTTSAAVCSSTEPSDCSVISQYTYMYMICSIIINRGFSSCSVGKYLNQFSNTCNKNYHNNIHVHVFLGRLRPIHLQIYLSY